MDDDGAGVSKDSPPPDQATSSSSSAAAAAAAAAESESRWRPRKLVFAPFSPSFRAAAAAAVNSQSLRVVVRRPVSVLQSSFLGKFHVFQFLILPLTNIVNFRNLMCSLLELVIYLV